MFDTKIYHQFGCNCLGCHKTGCMCDYHSSRVFHVPLGQQIVEQNIYYKGYADGRRDEIERNKIKFRSVEETEKFAQRLQEGIKPLQDLLNEIKP